MSKAIRGITVEIGGDTTKLGKALEDSEKKSRSLQSELVEIEKSLKFNPGNIDLLNQKQTVLTQSVAETSDKLDILKEAERQVIEQFERGEVAEEQVRALQREVLKTENQLGKMKDELTATNKTIKDYADGTDSAEKHTKEYKDSVDQAGKELDEFKEKASGAFEVIKNGALALGAGATATAGYALTVATEWDKAFNNMQIQTGATAEEMESLKDSAEEIYKGNFGESIEDVANAMAIVKNQTKLSGAELENTTKTALLMRDTFDFDVNESIRGVNSLVKQFGISTDEAYALMIQGAQNGLNQNGDLMDVVNEYSVQFKNAGYTAEDMFNMLANGVESGTWSVDKLGDAVKEFNIRMSDGSAKEAVEALGFSWDQVSTQWGKGGDDAKQVFNMLMDELGGLENTTEGYTAGVGLMGTMFEDLGYDAIKALSDTNGSITTTSDALDNLNEIKYDDLGSAIGGLKRSLETDIIAPLGEELKPVVEEVIAYVQDNGPAIKDVISNIVTSVKDFITAIIDNKDVIISAIVAIGTGLLVWNVVSMINGVVNAIKAFKLANEGATIAQWALNLAMNANPIGIIIALIAGLVAGFIMLWNTSDEFRAFFINLWETLKEAVGVAIEAIGKFFSGLWEGIKSLWNGAPGWFKSTVLDPLTNFFGGMWDGLKNGASKAWDGIKNIFSGVANFFGDIFSKAWGKVKDVFSAGGQIFSGIKDGIVNAFKTVVNTLIRGINRIIANPFNFINGALNLIRDIEFLGISPFKNLWKKNPISIPQIPQLYRGGILKRGQVGLLEGNGSEAVVPLEKETAWISRIAQKMNELQDVNPSRSNMALTSKMDEMIKTMKALKSTIVLDTGVLVGETISQIDEQLGNNYNLRERGI